MTTSLLQRTLDWLESEGVAVEHRRHAEATSSEHISELRGEPLSHGCKALLMKIRGELTVVAVRTDRRTDNGLVRRQLRSQKLRFARPEELEALGLVRGRIPPFGRPLLPFRLVADTGLLDVDVVAFTAGTSTDSLLISTEDWARVAQPEFFSLVKSR
ncbi:MAG TPA: YbaK/EbsC family protein [Myxococcota bacterium]|nr:YbaK/EbsC family protein [Myxococcota bacterium]